MNPCAKCLYAIGRTKIGMPVGGTECRACARAALRRVAKLEEMIAAARGCGSKTACSLNCVIDAEAARIAKRKAAK